MTEFFFVKAVDSNGKKVSRIFSFDSEESLTVYLKQINLIPINIYRIPRIVALILRYSPLRKKSLNYFELSELFSNLHVIARSGIPIVRGLGDLAESAKNNNLKIMLIHMVSMIENGASIPDAFRKYTDVFGENVITMIDVGVETGNIDVIFDKISKYYKRIGEITSKIKQSLIYPAFTLSILILTISFWIVYVLPKIVEAFENFGIELPLITKLIIAGSDFLKKYFLFIIFAVFLLFVLIKFLRKENEEFKLRTDLIVLKFPILGKLITYFYYAFISEYMKVMISAGINISRTLEILKTSIANDVFKYAIQSALIEITKGSSISESFKRQSIFEPMIIRIIQVGETSGRLDEQLGFVSEYYYQKVDYMSDNMVKMIEPVIMTVGGIFMFIMILGLIGPIYQLMSTIGKQ